MQGRVWGRITVGGGGESEALRENCFDGGSGRRGAWGKQGALSSPRGLSLEPSPTLHRWHSEEWNASRPIAWRCGK